jgi:hypothetical protein
MLENDHAYDIMQIKIIADLLSELRIRRRDDEN